MNARLENRLVRTRPKFSSIFGRPRSAEARTATALKECIERGEMPADAQVIEDYGFDRCTQLEYKKMLLGLYHDVI